MGIDPTAVSAWTEIGGVELMRVKRERKTMGICPTVTAWTEIGEIVLIRLKREKDLLQLAREQK